MRSINLALFIAFLALPLQAVAAEADKEPQETRIEISDKEKRIEFYVDGTLSAVLDKDGLHVREGVNYGAALTDTGGAAFDEAFKPKVGADAK